MNAPRRLTILVIALAISSISGGALPLANLAPVPPRESISHLPTELSSEAIAAARVLGRLHTGLGPQELSRLAVAVAAESKRAGIPIELVLGLIRVESSGYNCLGRGRRRFLIRSSTSDLASITCES